MRIRPNETLVQATVKQVAPCADGQGFDVDLEIGENRSPDPANDFLRPQSGDRLRVYAAASGGLASGQQIQATLALAAGPFAERAILRESRPLKP